MKLIKNEYISKYLEKVSNLDNGDHKKTVVEDYWACCVSRHVSLIGRKEVLTGKAKFGIFGDGKELPQVVMARYFKEGDWRSGYYRDQTFMFAAGLSSVNDFFAQLYADAQNDPFSAGRQMNGHFATRTVDEQGNFLPLKDTKNISSDISPTAGQMARGLGLAMASKLARKNEGWEGSQELSDAGQEIAFVTIGDASTSEGPFWETLNAAAVNQVPMCVIVWDDGYGISVPRELQTVKNSISQALAGFEKEDDTNGIRIYSAKAWDYVSLHVAFSEAVEDMRKSHIPALIHVQEVTQPQGHSTSGSHERYKSKDRLKWEEDYDCILKMKQWMIDNGIISNEDAEEIEKEAKKYAKNMKQEAWQAFTAPIEAYRTELAEVLSASDLLEESKTYANKLDTLLSPSWYEIHKIARKILHIQHHHHQDISTLSDLYNRMEEELSDIYNTHLYSETPRAATDVPYVAPHYDEEATSVNGYQLLNNYFDIVLGRDNRVAAFGEDVGDIGDVNQGFSGMMQKYGTHRVFDTGIREWSIMGFAIGLSMRGFRPIAEIQYLDYLLYGLSALSDDLATVRYRTAGMQCAPAIIRTRGHRLEGVWHSGSPIGMILNSLRGVCVLVPRNMTQAAGFYNTMLQSDDPALIIECLNGYRKKEKLPSNLGEYTTPLGVPEIMCEGEDITVVSYGSCIPIIEEAVDTLKKVGISVELIDVQSLIPFDLEHMIVESVKKTNRLLIVDEDVPGGASAYILNKVIEEQDAYHHLDSKPRTLTAKPHRPPFGSDGDYFSKPSAEDVYEVVYQMMAEAAPERYRYDKEMLALHIEAI